MKNRLLTFAGVLALLATLGHFYAKPLMAQIRAAIVKNIDERGRTPYQVNLHCQTPSLSFCTANGVVVPAGKRLVLTGINGVVVVNSQLTGFDLTITFTGGPVGFLVFLQPPTFLYNDGTYNHYQFSQPLTNYVDAGGTPVWEVSTVNSNGVAIDGTMTGYLVDLSL